MEKVLQEPFWAHFLGTQTIQIVPKYIGSGIRQWHSAVALLAYVFNANIFLSLTNNSSKSFDSNVFVLLNVTRLHTKI